METILPLSADELEAAVVKPAERVGVSFEEGLVTTITSEVNYQPGALPLLQYALTELFERRKERTLTQAAYHAMGGAVGALAYRADDIYREQDEVGRETIRQMFLRLVTLGEGTEDTRRRVRRSELMAIAVDEDVTDEIIDTYAAYRLLSLDHDPVTRSPTVEVAHEAILREWERLREWLNTSRDDVRMHRQLAATAAEWYAADEDTSYLLRGTRLELLERWAEDTELALTTKERAFLTASITERERQADLERARQRREIALERRARRVLQGLVAVLLIATMISVLLAIFAFDREQQAQSARQTAEREASVNRSLVLANEATLANGKAETDLAMLLALEAVSIDDPPPEAKRTLQSVAFSLGKLAILRDQGALVRSVAFSSDSHWALSGSCATLVDNACVESEVILWNMDTTAKQRRFHGRAGWVTDVAFDPLSRMAFAAYEDGVILAWDVQTGVELRRFEGEHEGAVDAIAINPDGAYLVSGGADSSVVLWEVDSGQAVDRFENHSGSINSVAFNHDGTLFASGSADKTINIWELETRSLAQHLEGPDAGILSIVFRHNMDEPDTLVSAAQYHLQEWNLQTGDTLRSYEMPCAGFELAISPNGRTLATTSCQSINLLDLENWEWIDIATTSRSVVSLAISPDGRYIIGGQDQGYLELFNLPATEEIRQLQTDVSFMALDLSPDGRYLLTGSDGVAVLWDVQTGEEIRRFEKQVLVAAVGFSPDGRQAVIGSADWGGNTRDRRLVLVDVETGEDLYELEGHEFGVRAHAFSPDGSLLLTGSMMFGGGWADHEQGDFGDLILWDTQTGNLIRRFEETGSVADIMFSADGQYAYTTNLDQEVTKVWDVSTGQEVDQFEGSVALELGPEENTLITDLKLVDLQTGEVIRRFTGGHTGGVMAIDVSPDGRYLISGDTSGIIILWDYASGEEIRQFRGHTSSIWNIAFSSDGTSAFSSGYDGTVREWRIADPLLDELLDWVYANRYIREFTCAEREQYDIEPLCE